MPSTRRSRDRRLARLTTVVAGLFLLLVGLALLAIRFLKAPGHAQGAKTDLEAAKASLEAGDLDGAVASVQSARRHEAVSVNVQWPKGYDVDDLPEGWERRAAGTATYENPGLVTQPSLRVTGSAGGSPEP
jgi:hypothetical protein